MSGGASASGDGVGRAFLDVSRILLCDSHLPRVVSVLDRLSPADLWWRPNPASNSIGNLALHLAGNLRQWVVSGVGGERDVRDREAEFGATDDIDGAELVALLESAVTDAVRVLERTDPASLGAARTIQRREVTVLEAVYHAVEHFAMHTGQILYIAKLRLGSDLGFYRMEDDTPQPTWAPPGTAGT